MRWNLRMKAAERGIWKSTELRRMLADGRPGDPAGKMSGWWTGTPNTIKLDELDVICAVLGCEPSDAVDPRAGQGAPHRPTSRRRTTADGTGTGTSSTVTRGSATRDRHRRCDRRPAAGVVSSSASDDRRRVDHTSSRLLLRVFARRTVHPTAVHGLRIGPLLQQRSVRRLPPTRSTARRVVRGLPRVGCHPPLPVAVLDVSLVEDPLPDGDLRLLRPPQRHQRTACLPTVLRDTPASANNPAARSTSPTPPGSANNCSSRTCRHSRTAPHRHVDRTPATIRATHEPLHERCPTVQRHAFTPGRVEPAHPVRRPSSTSVVIAARAAPATTPSCCGSATRSIRDHAAVHGWSRKHTNDVRRTMRLVAGPANTHRARRSTPADVSAARACKPTSAPSPPSTSSPPPVCSSTTGSRPSSATSTTTVAGCPTR